MSSTPTPAQSTAQEKRPRPHWAKVVAEARRAAGLSQEDLAGKVGLSQSAVADWERGKSRPRPEKWKTLEEVLGVPVITFIEEGIEKVRYAIENAVVLNKENSLLLNKEHGFITLYKSLEACISRNRVFIEPAQLAFIAFSIWMRLEFTSDFRPLASQIEAAVSAQLLIWTSTNDDQSEFVDRTR